MTSPKERLATLKANSEARLQSVRAALAMRPSASSRIAALRTKLPARPVVVLSPQLLQQQRQRRQRRQRRNAMIAVVVAVLLLLLLLRDCSCDPAPVAVAPVLECPVAPECPAGPSAVKPPIVKRPPRVGKIRPRSRDPLVIDNTTNPSWLTAFRLQVSARSLSLATCFNGTAKPGALRWLVRVNATLGTVSDGELEPVLGALQLSSEQRSCVLATLSAKPYRLQVAPGDAVDARVSLVLEF
jgi:hypothetical protein